MARARVTNLTGNAVALPSPYGGYVLPAGGSVVIDDSVVSVLAALGGGRVRDILSVSEVPVTESVGVSAAPSLPLTGGTISGPVVCSSTVTCAAGVTVATVAALPTASSANRGQIWAVRGGASVADKLYICAKNATDGYEWAEIALTYA